MKVNGKQIVFYDVDGAEGSNPGEPIEPTNPEVKEVFEPHPGSGLANMLAEFAAGDDGVSDDTVTDGVDANDDKPTEFTNKDGEVNDPQASESVIPENNTNLKLEDLDKEALINEIKKNQRFVSERDTKLKEMEEKLVIPEGTFSQKDLDEFVKGVRGDLKGSWGKFKEKFDLPDLELVNRIDAQGSAEDRLAQWQETILKDKIVKEFNLEKGEFEVVKEDLYTPKTPSYRWRKETEIQERKLEGEVEAYSKQQADTLKSNQDQQVEDMKWYAETYHAGNTDEVSKLVEEVNGIPARINSGELPKDAHPFSLRNLLISANHEKLVKLEVDKAVVALTKQYNDKGFYIQTKETPFDVSNTNRTVPEVKPALESENHKFSPMLQSINQSIIP